MADPPIEGGREDPPIEGGREDPPIEGGREDPPIEGGREDPPIGKHYCMMPPSQAISRPPPTAPPTK